MKTPSSQLIKYAVTEPSREHFIIDNGTGPTLLIKTLWLQNYNRLLDTKRVNNVKKGISMQKDGF